jgi:hypothetical protein
VASRGFRAFLAEFDKEPFESLEFLENRIANQAADADLLFPQLRRHRLQSSRSRSTG